jgi:hypothetical protein
MADEKQTYTPQTFVKEYGPIAERIGSQIGVDPALILAKFGLETGWGKSVIPNSYNLGNIKDFSGSGTYAVDNSTKKREKYMQFEDPEVFADYYVDFMKRMYPKAIGAGSDVEKFTAGLGQGVAGSYADNPETYGKKISSAYTLVNNAMPKAEEPNPFNTGKTEAEKIAEEPAPPPGARVQTMRESDLIDAGGVGAAVGAGKGVIEKALITPQRPTSPNLMSAQEKLAAAQDKLVEAQKNLQSGTGASLQDLENEFKARQAAALQAADELKAAEAEAKALSRAPVGTAVTEVAEDVANASRKVPGASGASNWVRAMGQDVPDVIAETAENMRKDNPRGGQAIIDRDAAAKQRIKELGGGDYKLVGEGKSQLMLPPDAAAEKAAALEKELAEKQAKDLAERQRLSAEAERKRLAAEDRVRRAKEARRTTGTAVGETSSVLKKTKADEAAVQKAMSGVTLAEKAANRAAQAKPSVAQQFGYKIAKSPVLANTLAGAGTAMSIDEAIDRYKKGDYSGAVLGTIEAAFGAMSMTPPVGPVGMAVKGIGTAGGLGMIPIWIAHDYFGKKGAWAEDEGGGRSVMDDYRPKQ